MRQILFLVLAHLCQGGKFYSNIFHEEELEMQKTIKSKTVFVESPQLPVDKEPLKGIPSPDQPENLCSKYDNCFKCSKYIDCSWD